MAAITLLTGACGPGQVETPTPGLPEGYDPNETMWEIYSGLEHVPEATFAALDLATGVRDTSQVPVIIESMRYWRGGGLFDSYSVALSHLTGEDFSVHLRPWNAAMEWLGQNLDDYQPPADYAAWKTNILGIIDERMAAFLTSTPGEPRIDLTEVVWGGVRTDGIPDLRDPPVTAADEAEYLHPDDRVFGLSINGEHRAYPLRVMNAHEMANDTLGGEQIALAYCTLCGAAIAYDAEVQGQQTTFGTSGLLYRSNKLMYDRLTNSLWNQLTGEPVAGPLTDSGEKLRFFPSELTTWEEWRTRHPDTTALAVETGVYASFNYLPESTPGAVYHDYFRSSGTMFPVTGLDDRLAAKDIVVGVQTGGASTAYPIGLLREQRVINDAVGGQPVVVVAAFGSQAARVYERGNESFALPEGTGPELPSTIVDGESGVWSVTEEALVHEDGTRLERVPSITAFWLGWSSFHPEARLYPES